MGQPRRGRWRYVGAGSCGVLGPGRLSESAALAECFAGVPVPLVLRSVAVRVRRPRTALHSVGGPGRYGFLGEPVPGAADRRRRERCRTSSENGAQRAKAF